MNVCDYFIHCEKEMSNKVTPLRRTSFASCRTSVGRMGQLCEMQTQATEEIAHLRDIGIQSLAIIDEVIVLYDGSERRRQQTNNDI